MPEFILTFIIAALMIATGWLVFRPQRGIFWRWQQALTLTAKVLQEDALKHIHQCELHGDKPTLKTLAVPCQNILQNLFLPFLMG